jgi:hypothetical protein
MDRVTGDIVDLEVRGEYTATDRVDPPVPPITPLAFDDLPQDLWYKIVLLLPPGRRSPIPYVSHAWQNALSQLVETLFQSYERRPDQGIEWALVRGDWCLALRLLPLAPLYTPLGITARHRLFGAAQRVLLDRMDRGALEWSIEIGHEDIASYYLRHIPLLHPTVQRVTLAATNGMWYILWRLLHNPNMHQNTEDTRRCWHAALTALIKRRDVRRYALLMAELPPLPAHRIWVDMELAARYDCPELLEWIWSSCKDRGEVLHNIIQADMTLVAAQWVLARRPEELEDALRFILGRHGDYDHGAEVWRVRFLVEALSLDRVQRGQEGWILEAEQSAPDLLGSLCAAIDMALSGQE